MILLEFERRRGRALVSQGNNSKHTMMPLAEQPAETICNGELSRIYSVFDLALKA